MKQKDGEIVLRECLHFLFNSENVGADAHIGPCNIREYPGIRWGDVGIAPYKLNVASPLLLTRSAAHCGGNIEVR